MCCLIELIEAWTEAAIYQMCLSAFPQKMFYIFIQISMKFVPERANNNK